MATTATAIAIATATTTIATSAATVASASPQKSRPRPPTLPMVYQRNEHGQFVCPTCGVTKERQNSMHYHMKKHQTDAATYLCSYCPKSFFQKQTLELHVRTKHADPLTEDTAPPAFSCPFPACTFHSHTKGNCVIHCLRVHFQEEITPHLHLVQERRIYTCLHCQNEFQSTTAFYYHIKNCITFDKTTPKYQLLQELLAL